MDIVINLDRLLAVFSQPADVLAAKFFLYIGWIPFAGFIFWSAWIFWIEYIRGIYGSRREFILLALDVPGANEQTPAAVEKLFAHLAGAHTTRNLLEIYWEGQTQDSFSFEIVSIEGYTQYIVRTMPKYRDLIEAVVYAEYPEAEITEVDDYATDMPDTFPDDNYDIWGGEWILANSSYYPIRTYREFEHQLSGDFKDPLAALMELFSSLRKGEQCWYQIILTPVGQDFPKGADDEINKVIGYKPKSGKKKDFVDRLLDPVLASLRKVADFIMPDEAEDMEEEESKIDMLNLKPLQKKAIEAIQLKVSKLVFDVKIRFIYAAEKEVKNTARANSFVGVMKQFSIEDLNALKPDMNVTITTAKYFWKEKRLNARKMRLMKAYKHRSNWQGRLSFQLNIEELATIWHFPVETSAKAPMLQKVPSRKSEAPSYLPVEGTTAMADTASELQQDLSIRENGLIPAGISGQERSQELKQQMTEDIFSGENQKDTSGSVDEAAPAGPPTNLPIG
ncbi:hypothetical protein A2477_02205 [Candidatus Falkowbacteria bacterium RIFOXYC2_FULL_47_12]|uniref:DUF8128 domain-containing protein n=1 Tax=Candidatus Falkowbacteria bacterium RIFOXYC2_FULL_47_12 TaxID=1798004 RepID=A0A1F5TS36_9BACT|nr:MAG: hypothetical protein A2477_02205 [Candidatus Falkowbacteria bacterium RIFOXYC2_FULL_47_12]